MKKKRIFVPIIIVLLIVAIIGGGAYITINSKLSKIKTETVSKKPSDLGITEKQANNNDINKNYINILLLGVDSRDPQTDPGLADSIMILTLDKAHNKLKVTSLMRDMLIDNIQGEGATKGTTQDRINVIYKQGGGVNGGGQYSIKAINSNFDMNIKDYVKVDFDHFDKIVDSVGGVDINILAAEVQPTGVDHAGMQRLDGVQALAYSRIRHVGEADFQRTERQRSVLTQVFRKLVSSPTNASTSLNTIFPDVETSLSKIGILSDISYVFTKKIKTIDQLRLPEDKTGYNFSKYINGVYFLGWNKAGNITDLHKFIYEGDLK